MVLFAGLKGWRVTEKPEAKLRAPLGDARNLGSICPAEIFKTGPALTFCPALPVSAAGRRNGEKISQRGRFALCLGGD